jgi:LmbE family N-acetylglucosaminyl deacetylase/ubiquinone/menaquinone biosynthesis C-methylase UbiE
MKLKITKKPGNTIFNEFFFDTFQNKNNTNMINNLSSSIVQERSAHVLKYIDTLGLKKKAEILCLGCSRGIFLINLLERDFIVTAIDTSEEIIDIARKNCTQAKLDCNATFQMGNAEQLNLPDDRFDAVIVIGQIEYLLWDRWAFQEINRVIKPGGHLIMIVPNNIGLSYITNPYHLFSNFEEIWDSFLRNLNINSGKKIQKSSDMFYINFYIPSRFNYLLSEHGFEIIDSVSHGFGPFVILSRSNKITIKIDQMLNRFSKKKKIPILSELGKEYIVFCQKRERDFDIKKRHVFKNLDKRLRLFKSEQKEFFIRYDQWLNKNPDYAHLDLQQFDTNAYSCENILVISPHPDDEIIGCGGTLIKMLGEGSLVTVLQLTDGSSTFALRDSPEKIKKTIRLKEAEIVAKNLGITELILFKEDQSHFKCTKDNVKKLSEILNRLRPQVIFVPFVNDTNPDHIIANEILRKALENSAINTPEVRILSYEVWSLVPPNSFCLIDNQFYKKTEMLMKYRTGMKVVDYVRFCEDLNAYHANNLLGKHGFIEVFLNIDAKTYTELIQGKKSLNNASKE